MPEPGDPLDQPATREVIQRLHVAGVLGAEARDEALRWVEPRMGWWKWSSRAMAAIGTSLVLSGIVFFFAYNWAVIPGAVKFGTVETAILASLLMAWRLGLDRPSGKTLLTSAAVLVGVFFAVFGQTYQSQADSWELFAGWTLLIAGWVLVSDFAPLWLVWLLLGNLAFLSYDDQVLQYESPALHDFSWAVLALLNGGAWALRERLADRDWLKPRWIRWTLWSLVLGTLTLPTLNLILEHQAAQLGDWSCALLLVVAYAVGYIAHAVRRPDLPALTLTVLSACTVLLTLCGRMLFDGSYEAYRFLLFGFAIVLVSGGAGLWLRFMSRVMGGRSHA